MSFLFVKSVTMTELKRFLRKSQFPNVMSANQDGVLCFGGELSTNLLIDAYLHGIFPWPHEGYPLLWFFPYERGVLDFSELHVPRSLQKLQKKNLYDFRVNTSFEKVIEQCSRVPRKGQKGTWITPEMKKAYLKMYSLGYVLSVECFFDQKLVGGLYGIFIAGVFGGESMFGHEDNVSKLCVLETIRILKEKGLSWMDIQMVTPVMESLGGKYISRDKYIERLTMSQKEFFNNSSPERK